MNFTDLFSDKIETSSQTISAINCFGEYVTSKFNDLANFMAGAGEYASTYFSTNADTVFNKLGCVTRAMYEQACEAPEQEFSVLVKNNGSYDVAADTITVTGQDITDAFENQLAELRCQEQYITYCMNSENCTATEFMTRMRSLCPNMPGAVIEKFSNLIEVSGSPVDCLKNYFSLFKPNSVQYTDQTIELVDYTDYIGNVWQAAWQTVTDSVTSFFDNVWQGITDLAGFFERLSGAIVKLGKWIISKAFHELTTYYDKASPAVSGIMDLPLFQIHGPITSWNIFFNSLRTSNATGYSWDHYNHKLGYAYDEFVDFLKASMTNLARDSFDGVVYKSVCEVIVPSYPCDISLRLGETAGNDLVLSAYVVSDYGTWSEYDDAGNNSRIYNSLMDGLKFISKVCPLVRGKQTVDDTSITWHDITSTFLDYNSLATEELAQCLAVGTKLISDTTIMNVIQTKLLIAGIMTYMILMSKGFVNISGQNVTNTVLSQYLFNSSANTYVLSTEEQQIINSLDSVTFDLNRINAHTFRPYAKRNQLPVTIHYQTTTDRGREIVGTVLKIVIAVVAVVATIKLVKWRKRRTKDTLLAHANVDRLSWDVAANPTEANMTAFTKAWKKARRMDYVNGILGLSTGSGTDTISSALGTMSNIMGKSANSSGASETNSSTIISNLNATDTKIAELKRLISFIPQI